MSGGTSILGGKSVYCISEGQLRQAQRLAEEDPVSAPRIRQAVERLESELGRNELAALAFVIIERLRAQPTAR